MKTIKKFSLARNTYGEAQVEHILSLPPKAKFIHVGKEFGRPFIWAMLDDSIEELEERVILTIKDNIAMPEERAKYLGTYSLQEGHITEHVLEILE